MNKTTLTLFIFMLFHHTSSRPGHHHTSSTTPRHHHTSSATPSPPPVFSTSSASPPKQNVSDHWAFQALIIAGIFAGLCTPLCGCLNKALKHHLKVTAAPAAAAYPTTATPAAATLVVLHIRVAPQ
jgi:hypothetical protein